MSLSLVTALTLEILKLPALRSYLHSLPCRAQLSTELVESESESYVTTDGQSASLSWNKAPIWGLRPDLYYCQNVAGLLMWGALSDERMGLSFTFAAGPRQRSCSRARVPWDSRPHFTVSDSCLLFCSLPRLAGLQWRYSIPPPYGLSQLSSSKLLGVDLIDNNPFPRCMHNRCRGNVFTEPLLRNGSNITVHVTIIA
jgi:hypothetical protein